MTWRGALKTWHKNWSCRKMHPSERKFRIQRITKEIAEPLPPCAGKRMGATRRFWLNSTRIVSGGLRWPSPKAFRGMAVQDTGRSLRRGSRVGIGKSSIRLERMEGYEMALKRANKKKLDYEVSYIAKSPCRDCALENNLPECSNNCWLLSQVQALLAGIISCPSKFSEYEEYSLMLWGLSGIWQNIFAAFRQAPLNRSYSHINSARTKTGILCRDQGGWRF